jgi:cytochrome c oxidase subunit 3|nr:cytochrome c oxidase subunit 3 family protein [Candidatus Acidoferrales bacterium]
MSEATSRHPSNLQHHFADMEQQNDSGIFGMWVFLITEIMFFGAIFAAYAIYRSMYLPAFEFGSRLLDVKLGTVNTAVLIGSSLTMVLAVHAAQTGKRKALVFFLLLTMALGAVFLGIKSYEYYTKWEHFLVPGLRFSPTEALPSGVTVPNLEMFFCFYFFMTALHALHMIIGFGIMTVLVIMSWRGRFSPEYYAPIEVSGLYWHFVDIIWIFLFPLLYLIGGRYT